MMLDTVCAMSVDLITGYKALWRKHRKHSKEGRSNTNTGVIELDTRTHSTRHDEARK